MEGKPRDCLSARLAQAMPPPARVIHTWCIEFSKRGAARGTLPIAGKHVPLLGALTQSITARTQAARRKSPAHAAFRAPHSPIRREQPWHVPLSPGLMHRLQTSIWYIKSSATKTFRRSPKTEIVAIKLWRYDSTRRPPEGVGVSSPGREKWKAECRASSISVRNSRS